jgi:hypothetical protein
METRQADAGGLAEGPRLQPASAGVVLRAYATMIRGKLRMLQGYRRRLPLASTQDRGAIERQISTLELALERLADARDRVAMAAPELSEHRVIASRRMQERIERAVADMQQALPAMTERERAEILSTDLPLLAHGRRAFASLLAASMRDELSVLSSPESPQAESHDGDEPDDGGVAGDGDRARGGQSWR